MAGSSSLIAGNRSKIVIVLSGLPASKTLLLGRHRSFILVHVGECLNVQGTERRPGGRKASLNAAADCPCPRHVKTSNGALEVWSSARSRVQCAGTEEEWKEFLTVIFVPSIEKDRSDIQNRTLQGKGCRTGLSEAPLRTWAKPTSPMMRRKRGTTYFRTSRTTLLRQDTVAPMLISTPTTTVTYA